MIFQVNSLNRTFSKRMPFKSLDFYYHIKNKAYSIKNSNFTKYSVGYFHKKYLIYFNHNKSCNIKFGENPFIISKIFYLNSFQF